MIWIATVFVPRSDKQDSPQISFICSGTCVFTYGSFYTVKTRLHRRLSTCGMNWDSADGSQTDYSCFGLRISMYKAAAATARRVHEVT